MIKKTTIRASKAWLFVGIFAFALAMTACKSSKNANSPRFKETKEAETDYLEKKK